MKKWKLCYIILFFGICLLPFVGMFFTEEGESTENRTLAAFPKLKNEEGWNEYWLSDAGNYFQDHFAFRSELVTANALINGKLLGVSTASGVIEGTDGWLYYKDSLEDYLGTELLSERGLYNIAHSIKILQDALEDKGIRFLFTVAPNKNTLYGENMPYYYQMRVSKENNLTRLVPILNEEGVHYLDLKTVFENEEEILYHKRDSHWNNKGAALAAELMMDEVGQIHDLYKFETYAVRKDFAGDLDEMLYPKALTLEDEIYYDKIQTFAYVGEVESNFDPVITTVNPVKSGNLVMYRDSFGNALLPFLADAYSMAYFSRGVPYQISDVDLMAADTVMIERAERFLPDMAENPPVMEASLTLPKGKIEQVAADGVTDVTMSRYGLFYQISGRILPEYLDWNSQIYLRVNGEMLYEAFPMSIKTEGIVDDNGFLMYLGVDKMLLPENTIEVIVSKDGKMNCIYKEVIMEEVK